MLERVAVVAHKAIGVVVIDEEVVVIGEDVARGQVGRGQLHLLGTGDFEHLAQAVNRFMGA